MLFIYANTSVDVDAKQQMQFCYLERLKKLALDLSEKWPNLSQATVLIAFAKSFRISTRILSYLFLPNPHR